MRIRSWAGAEVDVSEEETLALVAQTPVDLPGARLAEHVGAASARVVGSTLWAEAHVIPGIEEPFAFVAVFPVGLPASRPAEHEVGVSGIIFVGLMIQRANAGAIRGIEEPLALAAPAPVGLPLARRAEYVGVAPARTVRMRWTNPKAVAGVEEPLALVTPTPVGLSAARGADCVPRLSRGLVAAAFWTITGRPIPAIPHPQTLGAQNPTRLSHATLLWVTAQPDGCQYPEFEIS